MGHLCYSHFKVNTTSNINAFYVKFITCSTYDVKFSSLMQIHKEKYAIKVGYPIFLYLNQ